MQSLTQKEKLSNNNDNILSMDKASSVANEQHIFDLKSNFLLKNIKLR